MLKALDDYGASRSYWHFLDAREQHEWFDEFLQRPYPAALSGNLVRFNWDFASKTFVCEWDEDAAVNAPSLFYVPFNIFGNKFDVILEPEEGGFEFIPSMDGSKNQFVSVKPSGNDARRKIVIKGKA
jgi:hypothetical protein